MLNKQITTESLVASESFQNYCLSPNIENIQYWENWLFENPTHQGTFEEAKDLVLSLSTQVTPKEIGEEFNRFQESIKRASFQKKEKQPRRNFLSILTKIAAVGLVLLSGFWAWNQFSDVSMTLIATDFGKTRTIEFPDGSNVILNANSTLQFAENWGNQDIREVELTGEAFFEVVSNKEKPFVVHTQKGDVEVLGTTFNVSQRSDQFDVTLLEGKVQIALPNQSKIILNPNEQVSINGKTIEHEKIDVESVTAWRNNKMKFKNTAISSVIERLKNDFGWNIKIENQALLKRKINASIPENDPKLLLEALSQIYDLKIEKIDETNYVIR